MTNFEKSSAGDLNNLNKNFDKSFTKSSNESFKGKSSVSLDIGGSLCKLCIFDPSNIINLFSDKEFVLKEALKFGTIELKPEELCFAFEDGKLHFVKFPTTFIREVFGFLLKHDLISPEETIHATGGGAYKFAAELKADFGVTLRKHDELQCLFKGLNYTLEHVEEESFSFINQSDQTDFKVEFSGLPYIYPYVLVNIGSGVSILKVSSQSQFERVSGSFVGGGTFYGLCKLLTGIDDFKTQVDQAEKGDANKLNMLVSDIYGGDYEQFGLKGDIVASAFGKVISEEKGKKPRSEDICAAMVTMIGVNIAQLAHFCAKENKVKHILFAGNFLRGNLAGQKAISVSVNYWSKGEMKALFLEHEGYFGAIGAHLYSKKHK